jgi:hypothetical protein
MNITLANAALGREGNINGKGNPDGESKPTLLKSILQQLEGCSGRAILLSRACYLYCNDKRMDHGKEQIHLL